MTEPSERGRSEGVRGFLLVVLLPAAVLLLAAGGIFHALSPRLERALAARIEAEAARRGFRARAEAIHVAPVALFHADGLTVERPGLWRASIASVDVAPRPWGCFGPRLAARLAVGRASLALPAGLVIEARPSVWEVRGLVSLSAELREPTAGLTLASARGGDGRSFELHASGFQPSLLVQLLQDGAPVLDSGLVDGEVRVEDRPSGDISIDVRLRARGVRAAVREATLGDGPGAGPGPRRPIDGELALLATLRPSDGVAEISRCRVTTGGAEIAGRASLTGGAADPRVDVAFDAERLDFERLFAASGLELLGEGADLGSLSLAARVRGRLADPASLVVTERLDFTPPVKLPGALLRLRGDFRHEVELPDGTRRAIEVSPSSPDFVALAAVPPLFVRTLLLAEDAGFYGHRGVDLTEMVAAVAASWSTGAPLRGASTLTQQLAKNLFLTRERSLRRKLEELALALLLESTLGKERILEIYLNVIEWGPGVHGLRPAARHYFGKEPAELTPKEMAFLVALIPGPIKYQRSFARGEMTPGFEPLVTSLLAKVHSVGGLSDEEYEAALAETLVFTSTEEGEPPSPPPGP